MQIQERTRTMKKIITLIFAVIMCLGMMSTVFAAEFKFTDVNESDWFYNDVKGAVEMGLINGKSETEYKPNDNLTYAEAIKLAACMNQLYTEGKVTLKNGDPWYQTYVDYCVDNGIIDKYYDYDEKATRAGYMVIFAHALPDDALPKINNVADDSIPDVPMTRAYAPEIYKLYRAGILHGSDEEHSCKPLDNIKRSEVAAILSRMMDETKRVKFTLGEEEQVPEETKPEETKPEETKPEETKPEETKALAIKTQPASITVNVGETAELKAEAEGGKAPYTYQWQKTVTITKSVTSDFADEEGKYEGAKTDTFKITLASVGSIKDISCKITDADGVSVTTEYVTVTFKEKSGVGVKDKFEKTESEEPINEDFLMYVEDVYAVTGKGTVASGRVAKGKLNTGDTIKIISANGTEKTATVAGIEMFKKSLESAEKGDNIGLLFNSEIDKTMVARGDSVVNAKTNHTVTNALTGTLKLLTAAEGGRANAISEGYSPQFKRNGHDFTGKITGIGNMNPGETKENVVVAFTSFNGVFYIGQELTVMEGGRTIGTFTVSSLKADELPLAVTVSVTEKSYDAETYKSSAKLKAIVSGGKEPYTYQWQKASAIHGRGGYSWVGVTDGATGAKYKEYFTGSKTASLNVITHTTYIVYRCAVTDANGETITSDYVLIAEEGSGNNTLKEEMIAEVTALVNTAKENTVFYKTSVYYGSGNYTYEWQDSINGVDNWKKTSNETTFERDSRNHSFVRCKITDTKTGEVVYTPMIKNDAIAKFGPFSMARSDYLKAAYVYTEDLDESKNFGDHMKTSKSYELIAVPVGGTGPYTYQWQYAGYGSDVYKNYKTTSEPKVKFTPTEDLGKECKIRCVITDANGKTVTSEVFEVAVVIDLT